MQRSWSSGKPRRRERSQASEGVAVRGDRARSEQAEAYSRVVGRRVQRALVCGASFAGDSLTS